MRCETIEHVDAWRNNQKAGLTCSKKQAYYSHHGSTGEAYD